MHRLASEPMSTHHGPDHPHLAERTQRYDTITIQQCNNAIARGPGNDFPRRDGYQIRRPVFLGRINHHRTSRERPGESSGGRSSEGRERNAQLGRPRVHRRRSRGRHSLSPLRGKARAEAKERGHRMAQPKYFRRRIRSPQHRVGKRYSGQRRQPRKCKRRRYLLRCRDTIWKKSTSQDQSVGRQRQPHAQWPKESGRRSRRRRGQR
mmetsp:Transcript_4982/g.9261  ORF Transcript_4982/g.9261 Transcript_4982/m.9261 type:complete len:207 (+) Transcript_4982:493-1113(+)